VEDTEMAAKPLRRLVAVAAGLTVVLLPQPASSVRAERGVLAGDRGSGPPMWLVQTVAAAPGVRWSDVPASHWARNAIDFVAGSNAWMRDYKANADGSYPFRPDVPENRRSFARALVKAFEPTAEADPSISFSDVASGDRSFRWASVAVSRGWMQTDGSAFRPTEAVTVRDVHRALVLALGLGDLAAGAQSIHLRDGTPLDVPAGFGTLLIGMRLGLRFNHGDEGLDVGPDDPLPRSEVAWSLYRAKTAPTWIRDSLSAYATISLPNVSDKMVRVVEWGMRFVGHPYLWGGDWDTATPSGYCCGWQPRGGFDCSGITWWILKRQSSGWDNTPPRPYAGWDLPQRASAAMATVGKLRWDEIRPGDLLFYDGNGDGTVDHVDTYLGAGWALDSGSSNAGVTITRVEDSWYEEHFVHGRRIIG
ncbi:MAG TPA: NlpC/P60 family protein, partial [Actinomycetota bacterium]|nr:NlpC/P60 family protein [Actinomycetota bacterium]